jgi:hypothetical protein
MFTFDFFRGQIITFSLDLETFYLKITRILPYFFVLKNNTTETRPEGCTPKE